MFAQPAFGPNSWHCGAIDPEEHMLTKHTAPVRTQEHFAPDMSIRTLHWRESNNTRLCCPTCRTKPFA